MPDAWLVDRFHSHLVGQSYANVACPAMSKHPATQNRCWLVWIELLCASICHQANWDKLHMRVVEVARRDISPLLPECLARISADRFREMFDGVFDSERLHVEGRVRILQRLGIYGVGWPDANQFEWLRQNTVSLGGDGLYARLRSTGVLSDDPLEKKVRLFVHQLLRYGLIEVSDPRNIAPAIDYHLIRLYLRTGRVLALQQNLHDRLSDDRTERVEFHTNLRVAVEEAMYYSAMGGRLRIDHLNDIEWQIARSFCTRRVALCSTGPMAEKPVDERIKELSRRAKDGCPLSLVCRGAQDETLRKLADPRSARSYY